MYFRLLAIYGKLFECIVYIFQKFLSMGHVTEMDKYFKLKNKCNNDVCSSNVYQYNAKQNIPYKTEDIW